MRWSCSSCRASSAQSDGEEVSVGIGRFGPFAKRGSVYASLKKEDDPYTIDLARAVFLIEEKEEIARNRIIKEFAGQRHPGAQRPLRPVHQRRQAQRPHSQGSRAGVADAGGSAEADGRNRQADARPLRQEGGGEEGAGEEGRGEEGGEDGGEEGGEEGREEGREEDREESDARRPAKKATVAKTGGLDAAS